MEYTIEITQYCENGCDYCSSCASPKGKHLNIEEIRGFIKAYSISHSDRINISGGEPIAHPQFYQILKLCYEATNNVWVYTNALRQIKYNAHVLNRGIEIEANYCLNKGCLERPVYIPEGVKVNLLKFVPAGRGINLPIMDIHVSGNMHDNCNGCEHVLLQADGKVVNAPCQKQYESEEKIK